MSAPATRCWTGSRIYIDVLTPGASYLLDTGGVFPTAPIPEPATLWSLLAGALRAAAGSPSWAGGPGA
jgi:hypothetical protein